MVNNTKWYSTTGAKIGIVLAATAIITGIVIAYKKFTLGKLELENGGALPPVPVFTYTKKENKSSELPNKGVGCGEVKENFDRAYNYVKCNGVWWTMPKNGTEWKSLADNKTATDLLNNKYPN